MKAFSFAIDNTRGIFPIMYMEVNAHLLGCPNLKLCGMYYLCQCYSEREAE